MDSFKDGTGIQIWREFRSGIKAEANPDSCPTVPPCGAVLSAHQDKGRTVEYGQG